MVGRTLAGGRFELVRQIGQGGMGTVYEAHDRERRSSVALKTMRRDDPAGLLRFKHEFRALADVYHRNLVRLHELVADGTEWFFTMELLEAVDFIQYTCPGEDATATATASVHRPGSDDAEVTGGLEVGPPSAAAGRARPPLVEERLHDALGQLISGVSALHAAGHLHCDLKPSNVLVTADGRVVIVDFGIATSLASHRVAGELLGTPAYMAPEQAPPHGSVTPASDWYAVGVMLYEALAGRRPFTGSPQEILQAKRRGEPAPPDRWAPGVTASDQALCMALLSSDPERRVTAAMQRRTDDRNGVGLELRAVELIGRKREFSSLRQAFAVVRGGAAAAVFIGGRSGMGKSSLVHAFLGEVAAQRSLVLSGRCCERESVPYKALDSLVDSLCEHLLTLPAADVASLLPVEIQALAITFPVLQRIAAIAHASAPAHLRAQEPIELRRRAFAALRDLLAGLAARQPLVLFIDDLQWGDADSAPLLGSLVGDAALPALFLTCYRAEVASPVLTGILQAAQGGGNASRLQRIQLGRLALPEARELAQRLLQVAGATSDIAERVARSSRGNPYLVHELVRFAASEPEAVHRDGVELEDVIRQRVCLLTAEARRVVELVALAGKPVAVAVVSHAAALDERTLRQTLADLREAKLVRTSGGLDTHVEAYHDRIREAVASELSETRGIDHHRRLAAAIEALDLADADSLARHHAAAGATAVALPHARRAAKAAADALAFERAASLYGLARRLAEVAEPAAAVELARRQGEALANSGRATEAAEVFEEAAAIAPPQTAVVLRAAAGSEFLRTGRFDRGLEVLGPVMTALGLNVARSPRRAMLMAMYRRARVRLHGMRFEVRTPEEVSPEVLARIDALWKVASALGMVDTIRGADAHAQYVLFALRNGDLARVGRAIAVETAFACLPGMSARRRVHQLLGTIGRIAERLSDPLLAGLGLSLAALSAYQCGEVQDCRDRAREGEVIFREQCIGATWELTAAQLYWTWALYWTGEYDQLRRRAEQFVRDARERGDLYAVVSLTTGLPGFHWIARDRIADARRLAEAALASWSGPGYHLQHYWANSTRIHCDLYAGAAQRAYDRAVEQVRLLRGSFLLSVAMVRFEMIHLRGRCALALAATSTGRARARWLAVAHRDARATARARMPSLRPLADLLRAGIDHLRGRPTAAVVDTLERAEAALRHAGIEMFASAARRQRGLILGGAGGRVLVDAADVAMARRDVAEPRRLARLLVPGFDDDAR